MALRIKSDMVVRSSCAASLSSSTTSSGKKKLWRFINYFFATGFLAAIFLAGAAALRIGFLAEVDLAPSAFSIFAYVLAGNFFSAASFFLDSEPIIFFKNAGSAMVLLLLVSDVRIVHMVFTSVKLFYFETILRIGCNLVNLAVFRNVRSGGPYGGS